LEMMIWLPERSMLKSGLYAAKEPTAYSTPEADNLHTAIGKYGHRAWKVSCDVY